MKVEKISLGNNEWKARDDSHMTGLKSNTNQSKRKEDHGSTDEEKVKKN